MYSPASSIIILSKIPKPINGIVLIINTCFNCENFILSKIKLKFFFFNDCFYHLLQNHLYLVGNLWLFYTFLIKFLAKEHVLQVENDLPISQQLLNYGFENLYANVDKHLNKQNINF